MMRLMRVIRVIRVTRQPSRFYGNCPNRARGREEAQQMTDPRNRNEGPGREWVLVGGRVILVENRELRRLPRMGRAVGLASCFQGGRTSQLFFKLKKHMAVSRCVIEERLFLVNEETVWVFFFNPPLFVR